MADRLKKHHHTLKDIDLQKYTRTTKTGKKVGISKHLIPILKAQQKEEEPSECSICLDVYSDDLNQNVTIPCGHRFHKTWNKQILKKINTCPLCRARL